MLLTGIAIGALIMLAIFCDKMPAENANHKLVERWAARAVVLFLLTLVWEVWVGAFG
jgi:hypothetical protein